MLIAFEHLSNSLHLRSSGSERGASLVEYSLLLVLLALICIAAISGLGHSTSSTFSTTGSVISRANAG